MPNATDRLIDELRSKLAIDEDELDQALMEQAGYYDRAGEAAVTAKDARDRAELELEELVAELDGAIRKKYTDADEKLPTEGAISKQIATLPRVKAAQRKHLDAKLIAGKIEVKVKSFEQRKDMLKALVQLETSRMTNLAADRGFERAQRNLGTASREQEKQERLADRKARANGTTRYTPRD